MKCESLKAPTNGKISASSGGYNSSVVYSCDPGYELVGVSSRSCRGHGQWDFQGPVCQEIIVEKAATSTESSQSISTHTVAITVQNQTTLTSTALVSEIETSVDANATTSSWINNTRSISATPTTAEPTTTVTIPVEKFIGIGLWNSFQIIPQATDSPSVHPDLKKQKEGFDFKKPLFELDGTITAGNILFSFFPMLLYISSFILINSGKMSKNRCNLCGTLNIFPLERVPRLSENAGLFEKLA